MRKIAYALLLGLVVTFFVPSVVGTNEVQTVSAAAKLKLNKTSVTIAKGETLTLKLGKISSTKVKWKSSNSKVAKVSKKGVVTGVKKGTIKISATYKKKTYRCTVKVETPSLSKTTVSIQVGKSYTIKLNNTKRSVTWTTGNKSVAKVSRGKITAVAPGTTTIRAKVGNKTYTCKVTVTRRKVIVKNATPIKYTGCTVYEVNAYREAAYTAKYRYYLSGVIGNLSGYELSGLYLVVDGYDANGIIVESGARIGVSSSSIASGKKYFFNDYFLSDEEISYFVVTGVYPYFKNSSEDINLSAIGRPAVGSLVGEATIDGITVTATHKSGSFSEYDAKVVLNTTFIGTESGTRNITMNAYAADGTLVLTETESVYMLSGSPKDTLYYYIDLPVNTAYIEFVQS